MQVAQFPDGSTQVVMVPVAVATPPTTQSISSAFEGMHTQTQPAQRLLLDQRVVVHVSRHNERCHGSIRFLGTTDFKGGQWVGVQLDLPFGRNDGTVDGRVYFKCSPGYGIFVRPAKVTALPERPLSIWDEWRHVAQNGEGGSCPAQRGPTVTKHGRLVAQADCT